MLKFSKLSSKALKLYKSFKTGSTVLKQGISTDYLAPVAKTNVYVFDRCNYPSQACFEFLGRKF